MILMFDNICDGCKKELGLGFWNRGGKQFAYENSLDVVNTLEDGIGIAKRDTKKSKIGFFCKNGEAQDFLDCLACLGSEKVKELIEKGKRLL